MPALPQLNPRDGSDELLLENVRPSDWVNPEPASRYNLVVVGGGTAGLVSAAGAAILGARVALVERALLGGDCLVHGCVPSKALLRAGRAIADARAATAFGAVPNGKVTADFGAVMERVRRVRARISEHDSVRRFSDLGAEIFLGQARFTSGDTVEVDGKTLRFRRAVIATGGRPIVPPIPGLDRTGYLTNETVFNLTTLPARLLVLGAGPIGVELAQAFARLGSEVTVVEMMERFLPREDPDAARIVEQALARDGVKLRLSSRVERVAPGADGHRATLLRDGVEETLAFDQILIGVGRAPNVEGLGLGDAGVEYDEQGVKVDDRLRTTNRRIYAAGDVSLTHKFTHTADAAARIVLQNALFPGPKKTLGSLVVPWVTYSDPEVAHVGLYEDEARERGLKVTTFKIDFDDVDRAITDGEEAGFVKVHVREGSDEILGATIVGRHAGEMLNEISLAMVAGIGLGSIGGVIHPYPTQAEAIRKAADAYRRTRLSPTLHNLMGRWFRWTR